MYSHRWSRENWGPVLGTSDLSQARARIAAQQGVTLIEDRVADVLAFEFRTSAFSQLPAPAEHCFVNGIANILSRKHQGLSHVTLGSGAEIPESVVAEIVEVCDRLERPITWAAGDFVLMDNHRCMHGRRAFTGDRLVLARFGRRAL